MKSITYIRAAFSNNSTLWKEFKKKKDLIKILVKYGILTLFDRKFEFSIYTKIFLPYIFLKKIPIIYTTIRFPIRRIDLGLSLKLSSFAITESIIVIFFSFAY